MNFYWLVLGALGVWRITHLLFGEDGPGGLFARLRRLVGHGFWGDLLDCFYCLSLWTAAPVAFALGSGWKERLLLWPALSAGGILLEKVMERLMERTPREPGDGESSPAVYFEIPEERDVLLRK